MKVPPNLLVDDRIPVRHVSRITDGDCMTEYHIVRQATCPTASRCPACRRLVIRGAGRWWE